MALRMVRSFRAVATRATSLAFPALTRRSRKALRSGLWRAATMAPRTKAERTGARPPPMKLLPFHWPDWRGPGAGPARAASRRGAAGPGGEAGERRDLATVEASELGQLGQHGAGDGLADARHGGEQVLLVAPC